MNMGLSTKQDILAVLYENRAQLRSLGVRRLGLFGSFVRGEQRVDSDVDFLVEFEPDQKTFDHFMNLAVLLEDLLHRRIELVTTDALSPYIGPYIMGEVEYAALAA
jgi:predicted nucleotidyltransferase